VLIGCAVDVTNGERNKINIHIEVTGEQNITVKNIGGSFHNPDTHQLVKNVIYGHYAWDVCLFNVGNQSELWDLPPGRLFHYCSLFVPQRVSLAVPLCIQAGINTSFALHRLKVCIT